MCRLTAWIGPPRSVSTLMWGGDHPLVRQSWAPRELLSGSVNADGWGAAWWTGEGPVRMARAEPPWYDPDVRGVLEAIAAPCALAALRNASQGLPVDRVSVPPLVRRGLAFALNGFVPDFRATHMRALRSELTDDLYGELQGVADSETLFHLVLGATERGLGPVEAVARTLRTVLGRVEETGGAECQLTVVVADGERLVACRTSNRDRVNSLYAAEDPSMAPGGWLLASERLDDDPAWRPVPRDVVVSFGPSGMEQTPLTPDR